MIHFTVDYVSYIFTWSWEHSLSYRFDTIKCTKKYYGTATSYYTLFKRWPKFSFTGELYSSYLYFVSSSQIQDTHIKIVTWIIGIFRVFVSQKRLSAYIYRKKYSGFLRKLGQLPAHLSERLHQFGINAIYLMELIFSSMSNDVTILSEW